MMNLNDKVQLQTTVPQEQIRLLYSGLPITLAISLVISSLLTVMEWPLVDHTRLLIWLGLFFLVVAIRASSFVSMRQSATNSPQLKWLLRFRLGVLASAIMWGLGGYWMFPSADPVAQYWLTLILLGVSAIGAASHSVDRISALLTAYLPLFPIVLLLMLSPQVSIILPIMGIFYLLYVTENSRRTENNRLNNIRLRLDAATYTEKLRIDEERWNLALEGAGAGVWDWDIENDRVIYSKSWKSQLGYRDDEISDDLNEWKSRIHPDDKASALAAFH